MAENLNHEFLGSYSVEGDTENNKKYGRLYTRKAAMAICPEGWHVPSDAEWKELEKFVADSLFRSDKDFVGYALKAKDGWEFDDNGTDAVGFGALPAGYKRSSGDSFIDVLENAYFWNVTKSDDYSSYYWSLDYNATYLDTGDNGYGAAMSVRCVKD